MWRMKSAASSSRQVTQETRVCSVKDDVASTSALCTGYRTVFRRYSWGVKGVFRGYYWGANAIRRRRY